MLRAEDVSLELFLDWLAEAHGRRFRAEERSWLEPSGLSAICSDGQQRLALEVRHLLGPVQDKAWEAHCRQMEADIAAGLSGAYALWLPPGADLPQAALDIQLLSQRVQAAASALEPGQRSHLELPVTLYLRKKSSEGALMSVSGALDPYWARMSERVRGAYDLDSTMLHRLPESEEHRNDLLGRICSEANGITTSGQWLEIETIDAWTIQRLREGEGMAIVGLPPQETREMGISVRRNLRRLLIEVGQNLSARACDLRAAVLLGTYTYIDKEGATTALRGYDPSTYAHLDFICLISDGRAKAMMESPALPWARRR